MTLLSTLLSTAVGIGTRAVYELGKRHYDRSGRQARRARSDVDEELKARVEQELEARGIPEVQEELALRVLAEMQRRGLVPGEQQAQQEEPVLPTEPIDLDKAMPSSNINAFKYNPDNGNLLVQFKGDYPNEEGSVYSYDGVPPEMFDLFKRGAIPATTKGSNAWGAWYPGKKPSAGSSMYHLIRDNFPFQKVA